MVKSIPLTHGQIALVDDDLYPPLSQYKWHVSAGGYACTTIQKKKTYMHRLVMNAAKGQVVDHIQSNAKLDNRRENLRIVTPAQNVRNTRVRRDSSTGFKGVTFRRGKWSAYITHQGTRYSLGTYDNLNTAALVYDCACRKLFGEYCQPNLSDTTISPEIEAIIEKRLNPPPRSPRRSSKYKGVSWDKGKWRARLWYQGKTIHLGNFDNEGEAAKVYQEHFQRLRGT